MKGISFGDFDRELMKLSPSDPQLNHRILVNFILSVKENLTISHLAVPHIGLDRFDS